jgi:hypothetical protein
MFEMTTEKVFHADDKYVLRLLNVIIHEHQFKRKGIGSGDIENRQGI